MNPFAIAGIVLAFVGGVVGSCVLWAYGPGGPFKPF